MPVKVKKAAERPSAEIHEAEKKNTSANMAKAITKADSQAKARNTILGIIKASKKRDEVKKKYSANLLYQDKPAKTEPKKKNKEVKNIKENHTANRGIDINYERIEKDKRLMMWAGVTFFMVLIASAWIYNTKKVFEHSNLENDSRFSATEWQNLTAEIDDKIGELKENLKDIKEFTGTSTEIMGKFPGSEATTTNIAPLAVSADAGTTTVISEEQLEFLKAKLETGVNNK